MDQNSQFPYGLNADPAQQPQGAPQNPQPDPAAYAQNNAWQNPQPGPAAYAQNNGWQNPQPDPAAYAQNNAWQNPQPDPAAYAQNNAWQNPQPGPAAYAQNNAWQNPQPGPAAYAQNNGWQNPQPGPAAYAQNNAWQNPQPGPAPQQKFAPWENPQPNQTPGAAPATPTAPAKKKNGMLLKILIPVIVLVVAGAAAALIFLLPKGAKKTDADAYNLFSEDLVSVCKNGEWGYADKKGNVVIDYQFSDADDFSENGLASVCVDNRYGYINRDGAFVVEPKYYAAYSFCKGRALVRESEDGKYGYIDETGAVVIPMAYDDAFSFQSNGLAMVFVGDYMKIIDLDGNRVADTQYRKEDSIDRIMASLDLDPEVPEIRISVKENDKYGYIDTQGTLKIACQYEFSGFFHEDGRAFVAVQSGDERKYGLIDAEGTYVVNPVYDDISICYDSMTDAPDGKGKRYLYSFEQDDKVGVFDSEGVVVIPAQYDDVLFCNESVIGVQVGDACGLIDRDGVSLAAPGYDEMKNAGERIAVKSGEKWGFLDFAGNMVVDCRFDEVNSFSKDGLCAVRQGDRWGFINADGETVIDFSYYYSGRMYDDGFAYVAGADKKLSLLNSSGELLLTGLDGVGGNAVKFCAEPGCYSTVDDDEEFCETHSFDFHTIISDIDHPSYAKVSDDGLSCRVTAYYYIYLEEFDDGIESAVEVFEALELPGDLRDVLNADGYTKTYSYNSAFDIKVTYSSSDDGRYYYFDFEALRTSGSGSV